jgi:fluoride exporter
VVPSGRQAPVALPAAAVPAVPSVLTPRVAGGAGCWYEGGMRINAATFAAISAGGVLGALARFGLGTALPGPWATWLINVTGCLLLGALMAVITHTGPRSPLLRPFLGVGVLGGYTTFSTAMLDALRLAPPVALLHLFGTLVPAVLAVAVGWAVATRVVR